MIKKLNKTFYEVTGRRLDNVSQLKLFNVLEDNNGDKLLNIFNSYELNDDVANSAFFDTYEVDNEDWWENISYGVYGTPYLWWTIALTNKITNPFEEIEGGKLVYLLKSKYIYQLLKEIRNIGQL